MGGRDYLFALLLLPLAATVLLAACSSEDTARDTLEPGDAETPRQETEVFGGSYSGEGADSPEAAVRLLLEGIGENDQDKVLDATDPDYRNDPFGAANLGLIS